MEARDILIRPLITETYTALMEEGKYVFVVAKAANKTQIAKAVADIFNVKVEAVNTINVMGKVKRLRGKPGRTSSYKKAIVRLAAGETIQAFEGV